MHRPQYAYFVALTDGTLHLVVTHACSHHHAAAYFSKHLEDVMKRDAKIETSRMSIQKFWFHGEVDAAELRAA